MLLTTILLSLALLGSGHPKEIVFPEYVFETPVATGSDVLRVANRLLNPEDMVVIIVGDWGVIREGDMLGRATMEDIRNIVGGEFVELPLRNPLTLEALDE